MKRKLFPILNDTVFKYVFANDLQGLSSLVSSILDPTGQEFYQIVMIRNPENFKSHENDKQTFLDLVAITTEERIIQIEVQILNKNDYIQRSLYYATRLYSGQLKPSEGYFRLKPIIQINLIDFNLFDSENMVKTFRIREDGNPDFVLTEDFRMVYVELKRFDKSAKELSNPQDYWIWFLKNCNLALEEDMNMVLKRMPNLANAYKILELYSSDPDKRREIEERLKVDEDYAYQLSAKYELGEEAGMKKGLEKGLEMGVEKGMEKGKLEKSLESARLMKEYGDPIDKILKITGLSEDQLKENGII